MSDKLRKIIKVCGIPDRNVFRMIVADACGIESDGGKGSGNFGHKGRPGMRGGSGKGGYGASSYNPHKNKEYTLSTSKVGSGDGKRSWVSKGKSSRVCPEGTGSTFISEHDVMNGFHSVNKYIRTDGSIDPKREAIHQAAVDKLFSGKKQHGEGETKVATFLGGGSAAGKSMFTDPKTAAKFGLMSKKEVAVIDADELKKELPEYLGSKKPDVDNAASFAHEESSAMSKRAIEAAILNGYDYTLDGTGDGSVEKMMKKIEQARKAGYHVEGAYSTVPLEEAYRRSDARALKTGRKVPHDQIENIHRSVSQIFPQIAKEFDHVTLYDNNQGKGNEKLIAECYRGQEIKVYDRKLYDEFLAKGR